MYSEQLEAIIDAALADGMLTDKEREVLHKRAAQEGIDADELDVVIEGRLAKMKKQEDWLRPAPPQNLVNEKLGNIVKCPNCGCTDVTGRAVCPDCGYAFANVKTNSSAEKLANKLAEVEASRRGSLLGGIAASFGGGKTTEKASIIKNFPVPNTRDDLLEFLSLLKPKSSKYQKLGSAADTEHYQLAPAYYIKYVECIDKARRSFGKDAEFKPYFDFYEEQEKMVNPAIKIAMWIGIGFAALYVLSLLLSLFS